MQMVSLHFLPVSGVMVDSYQICGGEPRDGSRPVAESARPLSLHVPRARDATHAEGNLLPSGLAGK